MNSSSFLDFINKRDRFAASNGMLVTEVREGYAKSTMKIEERHLNGVNIVQGGALFTLADLAFAAAVNFRGQVAVALSVTISFFKPAFVGDILTAEAVEVSLTRKTGHYTVSILNSNNILIAQFQGTAFRKEEAILTSDAV